MFTKGHKIRLGMKNKDSSNEKNRLSHLGKKYSHRHRTAISKGLKRNNYFYGKVGELHPRWIKDRTKLSRVNKQGERRTAAYFEWRKRVWIRDNWECKIANEDCTGRIEAHHVLGWKEYPELRYQINNGITLCHAHHPRKHAEEKLLVPKFQELIQIQRV